ncbi:MAG: DUF4129 domain-containing protein, partial [Ktedonobacterales bacterium]
GSGAAPKATPRIKIPDINVGGVNPNGQGQSNPLLVDAGLTISVALVLLLLFALLFAIWWRLVFRDLSPITAAFARITRLGTWAGAPPRRSQTPEEYAEQLAHVVPGQRPALQRLSTLYSRERYGGGPSSEMIQEAPRLYDSVRHSVSPVILRRLRTAPRFLFGQGRRALRSRRRPVDE